MKDVNILDCTLRDGGYYNNWDFEPDVVESYLAAVADSKVEYIELGLRNFPKDGFLGAFAYTTEDYINSMHLPEGPIYGVMVDAKTILDSDYDIEKAVSLLFAPSAESKIDLVRVAAHFHEVEESSAIVKCLKNLGYDVGFNLMQAGGKPNKVLSSKALHATNWDGLDVLYFADSLGNMNGDEVRRIVKALRVNWQGPLGIHTHNNMGKGLDNTLAAQEAGVTWFDATITGMGRGAGNTQTESLLAVIDGPDSTYRPKPIYELVIRHFEAMQKKYGWGSNLLYFLGAQNDVHPTYIQNLLSNTHYGTDEIIGAIDYLSKLTGTASYNGAVLDTALSFTDKNLQVSGSLDAKGLFSNSNVLIIANAPSTKKYAKAIELYIRRVKPVVISINIASHIAAELIDFYVISHNSKFLSDSKNYKLLNRPLILPKCRFSESELRDLSGLQLIDYGVDVVSGKFSPSNTYATIPYDVTSAYILSALLESDVAAIQSVGFDGYAKNDVRQQEMMELFALYNNCLGSKPITSLTPTSYPIGKGSIYAQSIEI